MKQTERVRVFFSKTGDQRFLSHLDLSRQWERALRRSALPLEFTHGFNPRLRLSFSAALPTCVESEAEYVELSLNETVASEELVSRLHGVLPPGIRVKRADRAVTKRSRPKPPAYAFEVRREQSWPPTRESWREGLGALPAQWRDEMTECRWFSRSLMRPDADLGVVGQASPPEADSDRTAVLRLAFRVREDGSTLRIADVLSTLVTPAPEIYPLRIRKLAPIKEE